VPFVFWDSVEAAASRELLCRAINPTFIKMASRLLAVQRLLLTHRVLSASSLHNNALNPLRVRRNVRWIHSSVPILKSQEDKQEKETEESKTAETKQAAETKPEKDDDIPPWQNPLHHNNPELDKIFPEDFAEGEEMPVLPLPPMAKEGSNVQAPQHIHDLADEILNLSMLEMKQLVDKVAEHFGFDTQAVAMSLGGGGGGAAAAGGDEGEEGKEEAAVEEKTLFDLKLVGFDAKAKIKVIKEVRAIGGLGLKEAKELVEGAPKVIKKDIKKEEAEELQKKLEEVGATIEVV
jgi:large subunit ribosomal protein L7/L12